MKKVLLCMLMAGLMTPVVAQEKRFLDVGGWKSAGISKSYDRQSQNAVYPMTTLHDDGFIGCTWTTDDNPEFSGSVIPNRGVAYSYSTDGGFTWSWNPDDEEKQENRIGGIPLYNPSYAQWGKSGEAVLAKSADTYEHNGVPIVNGLVLLTRENRGEGEWNIISVPYPEGTSPDAGYVMACARMTTSGPNHEYLHIMSPMALPESQQYKGYYNPVLYYRTQDGGLTWDIESALVPEMVGQEWDAHSKYRDGITFANQGNTVACAFIDFGSDGYVLRSRDNGETWESIRFFDTPVGPYIDPSEYADAAYIPAQGCIALDLYGKIHVAFSVVMAANSEEEGLVAFFSGFTSTFLSYWNEDMAPIDGEANYSKDVIEPIVLDYFDWERSDEEKLYVISTVPQLPIIGYFIPMRDDHYFYIDHETFLSPMCYGIGDAFSFPQMAFDLDNQLHLTYLGLLNGHSDYHHPFYTSTADGGMTWRQTEHLVNNVNIIDNEFAYLTLAGIDGNRMHLMAQVDMFPGTYITSGTSPVCKHDPTDNYFYHFYVECWDPFAIETIESNPLALRVIPNPASGQATVTFDGKGNITLYNMIGQTVYHAENIEKEKIIPLNNMAAGVYFVTVRTGNAMATQKLVVK
ncbi:MAG: T9SS type A sorting domain-containing protein [Bacteroidales bacterium]|nr:T9SS type A sorting domain-containing protein [Bacteroidales bacterium]